MFTEIWLIIVTFVVYTIYRDRLAWRAIYLSRNIPAIPIKVVLANIFAINRQSAEDMKTALNELKSELGSLFSIRAGSFISFVCSDAKISETIFASSSNFLEKSESYGMLKCWLNEGLLTSHGQKWQKRRKALTLAFHFNILEQFIDVFDNQSRIFVQQLSKVIGKAPIDIYPFVKLMTIDVLCETAMGVKIDAQTNSQTTENRTYVEAVDRCVCLWSL